MSSASPSARKAGKSITTRASIIQPPAPNPASDTLPIPLKPSLEEQKESLLDPSLAPSGSPSIRDRFTSLHSHFSTFEADLLQQQRAATANERELLTRLTSDLARLQSDVSTETAARETGVAEVRAALREGLEALAGRLTETLTTGLAGLTSRLDGLEATVAALDRRVAANAAQVPELISARIDEVKGEERREKEERLREGRERSEREQLLVNRVVALEEAVKEERRAERRMWEEKLKGMRVEWEDEGKLRVKEVEALKERIRTEVEALKAQVDTERREREETDRLISTAVEQYALTLQGGIRIIAANK